MRLDSQISNIQKNIQKKVDKNMQTVIGAGVAGFIIYAAAKWRDPERKKIEHTFRNIGYKVKDHEPSLIRTIKKDAFIEYVYNVPYGLIDDPGLQPILQKTLNKPVHVYFDGKLHIRIYKERLPMKVNYDWSKTDGWQVPIGIAQEGSILHDFDKIPHMTIAGMTRQGKTVLLKLILTHLTLNNPDDVQFYIIDLKGGLEFGPLEKLKQVKQVASNINEAEKLLKAVSKNIKKDMQFFKLKGYSNVLDTNIKKRTFIIVDEGAELTPARHHSKDEKKSFSYCQHVLSEICRVAGALGYRNIFCTQYPTADTLPRQIKQNSDAKISFRLPTEIASRVAIDEQGAERLDNVGRAIYRTHDKHILQVPFINNREMMERLGEHEIDSTTEKDSKARENIITFG